MPIAGAQRSRPYALPALRRDDAGRFPHPVRSRRVPRSVWHRAAVRCPATCPPGTALVPVLVPVCVPVLAPPPAPPLPPILVPRLLPPPHRRPGADRKSTRLTSRHLATSSA